MLITGLERKGLGIQRPQSICPWHDMEGKGEALWSGSYASESDALYLFTTNASFQIFSI